MHKVLSCPPRVYFPVLRKFWQLYSGVNGHHLQEVYAIPTPRAPVSAADHCQPVRTSTGGTQFCLSFCGVPGFWCTQGSVYALQESTSQSCVSSGSSVVGLMATSSKRALPYPSLLHSEPLPCGSPLLTRTSTGDAQTQFCLSLCGLNYLS